MFVTSPTFRGSRSGPRQKAPCRVMPKYCKKLMIDCELWMVPEEFGSQRNRAFLYSSQLQTAIQWGVLDWFNEFSCPRNRLLGAIRWIATMCRSIACVCSFIGTPKFFTNIKHPEPKATQSNCSPGGFVRAAAAPRWNPRRCHCGADGCARQGNPQAPPTGLWSKKLPNILDSGHFYLSYNYGQQSKNPLCPYQKGYILVAKLICFIFLYFFVVSCNLF